MKRLRYACEFMAPAYDGGPTPSSSETVEIRTALRAAGTPFSPGNSSMRVRGLERKTRHPDLLFVLGEIYQLQAEIARERREAFGKIWRPSPPRKP